MEIIINIWVFMIAAIIQIWLISIYLMVRIRYAYKFIIKTIEEMHKKVEEDIEKGKDYKWRYEQFNIVEDKEIYNSFKKLKVENYWKNNIDFLK
jgi:hypothetical protein